MGEGWLLIHHGVSGTLAAGWGPQHHVRYSAGAMLLEVLGGKQIGRSALIGYGAARGRLVGSFVKFTIGCVILLIAMIVAIPWHG